MPVVKTGIVKLARMIVTITTAIITITIRNTNKINSNNKSRGW